MSTKAFSLRRAGSVVASRIAVACSTYKEPCTSCYELRI
jgi:hypothetical protein